MVGAGSRPSAAPPGSARYACSYPWPSRRPCASTHPAPSPDTASPTRSGYTSCPPPTADRARRRRTAAPPDRWVLPPLDRSASSPRTCAAWRLGCRSRASGEPRACDLRGCRDRRPAPRGCSVRRTSRASGDGWRRSCPSVPDPVAVACTSVDPPKRRSRFAKPPAVGTSSPPSGWPGSPSRTRRALRGTALRGEPGRGF